jgi:exodeoxyribonuclease VII large subunit
MIAEALFNMTLTTKNSTVLTVSQLTLAIKTCLESTFSVICLQGEVSNSKLHTSGHLYFSIKDSSAQISAVMYRADVAKLANIPKDGTQVIVQGEISVYPPKGNYQLLVRELKPVGIGELLQKLEELKMKLLKKGYFKKERKRPLPKFPRKIGVVTSPTGAAIQDILNILTRRFYGFHLILNPVKVQGEGAAQEIVQAIQQFNQYDLVDVMIVGRGGGSLEDLWAFNEEIVADALFTSRIPTISAVGHEIDHCIADYVADVRAPTPSAAAEIVIAEKAQQLHHLGQLQHRMQQTLHQLIRHDRRRLEGIRRHPIFISPYNLLGPSIQKLDTIRQDIEDSMRTKITSLQGILESQRRVLLSKNPCTQIAHFKQRLLDFDRSAQNSLTTKILQGRQLINVEQRRRQIDQLMLRCVQLQKERLEKVASALGSIDPKNLLAKGYAILFAEKDHSIITSVSALEQKQELRLLLSDGEVVSTIKEIYPK